MNRRVFICGYYNFPRGSATANYIQYLANGFIDIGYEVIFITNINRAELSKSENFIEKNNGCVELCPIELRKGKIVHYIDFNFGMGRYVKKILIEHGVTESDLLITYSTDVFINKSVLMLAKKVGCKSGVCITEWFSYKEFQRGKKDCAYWKYMYVYEHLFPKYDYLFPISTYIEKHFKDKKCNTLCLPIQSNANEFPYTVKKTMGKWKFIYPANGMMKDSLASMLKAVSRLSHDELTKMEFHLCGVNKSIVTAMLSSENYKKINKSLILHSWMEYEELVHLYQQMHFLVLVREISQMTLANFPSKVPEVMCHGVVPVISDVGDYTKYYLKDRENSIFIHGASEDNVQNALKFSLKLSQEEYCLLSKNARKCAEDRFDYHNWTAKIQFFLMNM